MRLNKFIAHHSHYSRREADRLIDEGLVQVNKKTIDNTQVALQVSDKDKVAIKGVLIKPQLGYTVIIYHKRKGEIVSKRDDRGRTTIFDSLPTRFRYFMPIGRLDFASEGLLLLTDSSSVAHQLMASSLERIYNIKINGTVTEAMVQAMQQGITIDSGIGGHKYSTIDTMEIKPFNFCSVVKNTRHYSKVKVGITEGKNRELRRFFAHFKREVLDLKRVQFGQFMLNNLPVQKVRYLTKSEYKYLRSML